MSKYLPCLPCRKDTKDTKHTKNTKNIIINKVPVLIGIFCIVTFCFISFISFISLFRIFSDIDTVKTTDGNDFFIIKISSDIRQPQPVKSEQSEQKIKLENTIKEAHYSITNIEFMMIAYTVEQEAHELSLHHKIEISNVILNRVHHKHFPDNIKGVLTQKNQFEGFKNYITKRHKPTAETILAVKKSLRTRRNNLLFFYNRERVGNRPFFENNKKLSFVKEMDGHRFFKMI